MKIVIVIIIIIIIISIIIYLLNDWTLGTLIWVYAGEPRRVLNGLPRIVQHLVLARGFEDKDHCKFGEVDKRYYLRAHGRNAFPNVRQRLKGIITNATDSV